MVFSFSCVPNNNHHHLYEDSDTFLLYSVMVMHIGSVYYSMYVVIQFQPGSQQLHDISWVDLFVSAAYTAHSLFPITLCYIKKVTYSFDTTLNKTYIKFVSSIRKMLLYFSRVTNTFFTNPAYSSRSQCNSGKYSWYKVKHRHACKCRDFVCTTELSNPSQLTNHK